MFIGLIFCLLIFLCVYRSWGLDFFYLIIVILAKKNNNIPTTQRKIHGKERENKIWKGPFG